MPRTKTELRCIKRQTHLMLVSCISIHSIYQWGLHTPSKVLVRWFVWPSFPLISCHDWPTESFLKFDTLLYIWKLWHFSSIQQSATLWVPVRRESETLLLSSGLLNQFCQTITRLQGWFSASFSLSEHGHNSRRPQWFSLHTAVAATFAWIKYD